ncbi:hypothetical protein STCU_09596 [Strigomonas culicis]|uniref:DUF1935 domain-containing protein n=1 Tax=Strigomonas culicis TaxID=28005 RepID=S9TLR8_9TRYP|nr:hypothetical protein STCU_09596 [Strigomonas culicis]|eukprot:EPY19147.1 hypothetical protein STCU_09596 [Strigomonas culicis]
MTTAIPLDQVHFENGKPLFPYNECYDCFEGKGLLYRLVDTTSNTWAFYNDTNDTIIQVHAVFAPGSRIKALQRTQLRVLPNAEGTEDETCEQDATLEVEPGFTEAFIEGEVTGYNISFQSDSAPTKQVAFELPGPTVHYDKMYSCFKDNGNGLLFRLVDETQQLWYFYNDTTTYTMRITVEFGKAQEVEALGRTTARVLPPGTPSAASDGVVLCLDVAPGRTEPFLRGTPTVYKLGFAAEPAGQQIQYVHEGPDRAIIANASRVFKCFEEHENGLLFRVVDDVNRIWAFYNDTKAYVMTATVTFPADADIQLAPGVVSAPQEDGFTAAVTVAPLATAPFLVGAPEHYTLSFSAAPVGSMPVESPAYENMGPDGTIIQYQDAFSCFKGHGNGLLFRLVDNRVPRWAFYNDTRDVVAQIKVAFAPGAKVVALGNTRIGSDEELGVIYELELQPGRTELFAEGEVGVFTTKFAASKIPSLA